jgi:hypothetical protein
MDEKTFVTQVQAKKAELMTKNADALAKATPEEAKAMESEILKKAKAAVKQDERDEALKLILDTISAVANDDPDIVAAVAILRRETRHATSGLVSATDRKTDLVSTLFPNVGDTCDEAKLFAVAKYGRGDGRRMIQHAVKDAKNPEARKWIAFDLESGIYTLAAIGANPPQGWTGYLPVSLATDKAAATPDAEKPETVD